MSYWINFQIHIVITPTHPPPQASGDKREGLLLLKGDNYVNRLAVWCVCVRARARVCVCVCVCARARAYVCECVCV